MELIHVHKATTNYHPKMTKEKDFEELYLFVREKERRIYTDEQVSTLPMIQPYHIHYEEWQIRKRSADKLFSYLQQKQKPLSILEVGCGNGWLIASLSNIKSSQCIGIDVNTMELRQAKRVFEERKNLSFFKADIDTKLNLDSKCDVIVFAASIQYFSSFNSVISAALKLLKRDGEIHILDSHFYTKQTVDKAQERTKQYYDSMDCPEMATHYHHHLCDTLDGYHHKVLFNPDNYLNRLLYGQLKFPWIVIISRK